MKYPKIPLAQTLIKLCEAKGIKHIIISPGSRNAPLTIGFSHHPYFKCYSIVDERCAAFFALGIAQQLQEPTAVVCTSGSALLNYYPAVAEAFFSDIPLVVISADRPKHLIGIGDGQTINQNHVFENHILYSANLELNLDNKQSLQDRNEIEINKALNTAYLKQGPVHINVPFDEPLYDMVDAASVNPQVIPAEDNVLPMESSVINTCINDWNSASKKMILVGVNPPNTINQEWLDVIAKDDSVIVFTETTSNLQHDDFFPSIDKIILPLNDEALMRLQPEILLTFGGLIVSKKIKAFLRKYRPQQHWHIGTTKANDTFFSLNRYLEARPNDFFSEFLPGITTKQSDYKPSWNQIKAHRNSKHDEYLKTIDFSDFKAFEIIFKAIPNHTILQLGNSSTIRYAQLFDLNKTLNVFCNRGTSGIDGSTSTAIGCAVVNTKQTTFISGDLSFIYDSNALWNNYIPNTFRVIVINNQGGGIFRILPGHKNTENFDTYFETKHELTAEHLCKMYGFEYTKVSNTQALQSALQSFYLESNQPKLLEVFTPQTTNDEILLDYFRFIS